MDGILGRLDKLERQFDKLETRATQLKQEQMVVSSSGPSTAEAVEAEMKKVKAWV